MKQKTWMRIAKKWKPDPRTVVVGLPAYQDVDMDTYSSLEQNIKILRQRGVQIALIKGRGTYVHEARNQCVVSAFKQVPEFTHLMFIDADMSFNEDVIYNLMERTKDIVGGLYVQKSYPFNPNAGVLDENGVGYYMMKPDYSGKSGELIQVDMIGTGLMMVRRRVLEKMQFPWFEFVKIESAKPKQITPIHVKRHEILGEDVSFCRKAKELGFEVWLDLKNQGAHLGKYGYTMADYQHPDADAAREALKKHLEMQVAETEA